MTVKESFMQAIIGRTLHCCTMTIYPRNILGYLKKSTHARLRVGYTEEEFNDFLERIDISNHWSPGSESVAGTIWFTDGIWATKDIYDTIFGWHIHKIPLVDKSLMPQ